MESSASGAPQVLVFFSSPIQLIFVLKLYSSPTMQSVPLLLALILLGSASAQAQVTIEPVTTRGQTNCELCAKSSVVALQTALRSIFGTKSVRKGCETCRQISATHCCKLCFLVFLGVSTLCPRRHPTPLTNQKRPVPNTCCLYNVTGANEANRRVLLRVSCFG